MAAKRTEDALLLDDARKPVGYLLSASVGNALSAIPVDITVVSYLCLMSMLITPLHS